MDTKKHLEELFLHDKPAKLLTSLKGHKKYASILSKEVNCTYSHCVRILQLMEGDRLVDFERSGRIKMVSLTRRGEEIALALENLMRLFSKS